MWIVGLTGMIAGGKSTVAQMLSDTGGVHVDADRLAADATAQPDLVRQIVENFGPRVLQPTSDPDQPSAINRGVLAALVFGPTQQHRESLRKLESIVFPHVHREIANLIAQTQRVAGGWLVLDVPLLLTSRWAIICDDIWCIVCDRDVQSNRIRARNWTEQQLEFRSRAQSPLALKRLWATHIIDTTFELAETRQRVDFLVNQKLNFPAGSGGSPPRSPSDRVHCDAVHRMIDG